MRGFLLALTVALSQLLFTAPSAWAASENAARPELKTFFTLQKLETTSYQAATSFYLYSVLNRDPQQYKKMQTKITTADEMVKSLNKADVSAQWEALKRTLLNANFTSDGVADNPSLIAVDTALNQLTKNLRKLDAEERNTHKVKSDKMTDMVYDQYVLMQLMTAAYLRKSADYFGGSVTGTRGSETIDIEKTAKKFTSQLDQLRYHYAKNPEISKTLKEVTTKWVFIRGSLINFNQESVPFIVGRYNEQITERLLNTYEKLI